MGLFGSQAAQVGGPLGDAIGLSAEQRLKTFVEDIESPPIQIYSLEAKAANYAGDWYGEHAGKWLWTASRAAARTADTELKERVRGVGRFLVQQQEPNGYLGTYASDAPCRFTDKAATQGRTWDVWNHACLLLGLVEAHRLLPDEGFLDAAVRIVDLFDKTFTADDQLTGYGNHQGLSATVLLDPVVEVYRETGNPRHLALAWLIVDTLSSQLEFTEKLRSGEDVVKLGTGKAYQIIWNLVGLTKLAAVTGDKRLLADVRAGFESVRANHLTLGGGPWGGIGRHSELFNEPGVFSPYGFVETCSAMAWVSLCDEMLTLTGEAQYAEEAEKTVLNTVLGAVDENGRDWSYFTFPNGRRNSTYDWACCKSSGAMALERAAWMALRVSDSEVSVDFLQDAHAQAPWGSVAVLNYGDRVEVEFSPEEPTELKLRLRVPGWADKAEALVVGQRRLPEPGSYLEIERVWSKGDKVLLQLEVSLKTHVAAHTVDHHGQEVVRLDYLAATYGPYALATGLIDGFKREETLRLPRLNTSKLFNRVEGDEDCPAFDLNIPGRKPIRLEPYYTAGGRTDGKWRLTWLQVAWQ